MENVPDCLVPISSLFADSASDAKFVRPLLHYLVKPEVVFDPIWPPSGPEYHALTDTENSAPRRIVARYSEREVLLSLSAWPVLSPSVNRAQHVT